MVSTDKSAGPGRPTEWDIAHHKGYAQALEHALGISHAEAYRRTRAVLDGKPLDTTRAGTGSGTSTINGRGEWVPAVPVPLFLWPHRHQCRCGEVFWTLRGYRGHYALVHILGTP